MKYLGGKYKLGKAIGKIINSHLCNTKDFYEPFVGGFNIIPHIYTSGGIYASDTHRPLIAMYKALQDGWLPPNEVSEVEYELAKRLPDSDPNKAFIGFACSFGAKYFGGYARGKGRGYALEGADLTAKKLFHIKRVHFKAIEYNYIKPSGAVIYCDPTYAGTTGYGTTFSTNAFWSWAQDAARNNIVLVSEYNCPIKHEVLFEKKQSGSVRKKEHNYGIERLFRCET